MDSKLEEMRKYYTTHGKLVSMDIAWLIGEHVKMEAALEDIAGDAEGRRISAVSPRMVASRALGRY